ncbi:MAG: hypothetical protein ABSF13_07210 [Smithella sp.]|jgi:hypothetical protein
MAIDYSKLKDFTDLESAIKHFLWLLRNNVIEDEEHAEWRIHRSNFAAHIGSKQGSKVTEFDRNVYKSILFSEKKFNYQIYKGYILINIAEDLMGRGDLDETLIWLKKAQEEDKIFYTHPEYRPAYKILSFIQPIVIFRNKLWPISKVCRKKIGNRLSLLFPFSRSASAIAFKPELFPKMINNCIKDDDNLKKILLENLDELFKLGELCDKDTKFYKSMMFLVANIIEGILFNMCNYLKKGGKYFASEDLERKSIYHLAYLLRNESIIDEPMEYSCRFIQSYRDFIHPARNKHHEYRLDSNFNKMFLFYFMQLVDDLQRVILPF